MFKLKFSGSSDKKITKGSDWKNFKRDRLKSVHSHHQWENLNSTFSTTLSLEFNKLKWWKHYDNINSSQGSNSAWNLLWHLGWAKALNRPIYELLLWAPNGESILDRSYPCECEVILLLGVTDLTLEHSWRYKTHSLHVSTLYQEKKN